MTSGRFRDESHILLRAKIKADPAMPPPATTILFPLINWPGFDAIAEFSRYCFAYF